MGEPILFIHGMFVTPLCWEGWVERFTRAGHTCVAPAWPRHEGTAAELRARHPDPELGQLTLGALVDHFEAAARALPSPPILIGHSMGGLIVQLLLQRGVGARGVAIDSAPPKGVISFKFSFLKANWPVASPFVDEKQPVLLTPGQFRYAFAHTLSDEAAGKVYERLVVPESRRVGRATLTDAAAIDFARPRPPLLLIAGELDHIIPAGLNRKNHARYAKSPARTDFHEFPGRTHYLIGDEGWTEVADYAADWLGKAA
jgi:pimeloyl-ACP methyl ester carboxylesterase